MAKFPHYDLCRRGIFFFAGICIYMYECVDALFVIISLTLVSHVV